MKVQLYTFISSVIIMQLSTLNAQWCMPETAIPYNANMPGITHFTLNTIDRESADLEDFPNNSYVYTEMSTTLVKGQAYPFSITHTIDATICPDMNLRIWIDFNQDGDFLEIDEQVLAEDYHEAGTYEDSFTVPASAMNGTTRMRVTAKMSSNGGHTPPTPCDNPPDPFGYHGEFEDYDVIISGQTGIENNIAENFSVTIAPNPVQHVVSIAVLSNASTEGKAELFNHNGQLIKVLSSNLQIRQNNQAYMFDISDVNPGLYVIQIITNGESVTVPFVKQ